ncbi:MAG: phospholipase [Pseudonocardiales bacterium]|nr:MAG: phospholipase [Pseudonocardiales bacterium]
MTEQSQLGPSYDGTVVLDIGGDIGALILHAPESLAGVEIEISPVVHDHGHDHEHDHDPGHDHGHDHGHGHGPRTHVAIRERRGDSGVRFAAIYPELHAGEYTLWDVNGEAAERVSIVGGEITQIDWR